MPHTQHQRISIQESLAIFLTKLRSTPIDQLIRKDLGTELDFEALRLSMMELQSVASLFTKEALEKLPTAALIAVSSASGGLVTRLTELADFGVGWVQQRFPGKSPLDIHEKIVNEFDTAGDAFLVQAAPIVAIVFAEQGATNTDAAARVALEWRERLSRAEADIEQRGADIQKVLDASRKAAEEIGISRHAQHFAKAADEYSRGARMWLWVTALSFAVTVAAAIANLFFSLHPQSALDSVGKATIQLIAAKLILLSVLATVTVWCGRMYRAQRHNTIVNQHRRNALSSFEAFAQSTDDVQTRNAVLLQATQSIFSPQQSGYIAQEGVEQAGAPQLVELVRTIATPQK